MHIGLQQSRADNIEPMQHDPDSNTLTWLLSRLNAIQVRGIMRSTLGLNLSRSSHPPDMMQ